MRTRPRRARWHRWLLGSLALAAVSAGPVSSGCAASFDPPSKIDSLRVFSVVADKPYVEPGGQVTFKMTYVDGLGVAQGQAPRPVQILWLGGCFDPEGDQYFACFPQLAEVLGGIADGEPPDGLVAAGIGLDTFTLTIPEDIITRRPRPRSGPYAGIAYVFFAVCAGVIQPVPIQEIGDAGSFPLACFDFEGNRLGPESFVPGYTQVYSFEDGRENANPTIDGLTLDDEPIAEDFAEAPTVDACPLTEDERREAGCGAKVPEDECTVYELKGIIPKDVAERDPGDGDVEGDQLDEVVWVSYFADGGDIDSDLKLVHDAVEGPQDDYQTDWLPPSKEGTYTLWAVVRDNRGGMNIVKRFVNVRAPK